MEAVWMYRNLETAKPALLAELLECETPETRAAAAPTALLACAFQGRQRSPA